MRFTHMKWLPLVGTAALLLVALPRAASAHDYNHSDGDYAPYYQSQRDVHYDWRDRDRHQRQDFERDEARREAFERRERRERERFLERQRERDRERYRTEQRRFRRDRDDYYRDRGGYGGRDRF